MRALVSRVLLSGLAAGLLSNLPLAQSTWSVPGHSATVQGGLDLASDGDTVLVAPGTYAAAYLDFAGKAITLRSQAGPDVTTLTGNGANRLFWFDDGEGLDSVVQGFEIRDGQAPSSPSTSISSGGAVYLQNSKATFVECVFHENRAGNEPNGTAAANSGGHGGAIYLSAGSEVRLERCLFDTNRAGKGKAGQAGSNGADGTLISQKGKNGKNGFLGGDGGNGGAIYSEIGTLVIATNCVFDSNRPGTGGAGGKGGKGGDGFALAAGGDGGNGANTGDGGNAAIYALGSVEVTNCTLWQNWGALLDSPGAGGKGGTGTVIDGQDGSPGSYGANSDYGGIRCTWPLGLVQNSVSWGNYSDIGTEIFGCTVRYSDVEDGDALGGDYDATNIELFPLIDINAGYTPKLGSPLVDAADASLLAGATTDVNGYSRICDDPTGGGVSALDIGAAEWSQGYVLPHGCGINPAGSLVQMSGTGSLGTTLTLGVHDPTGSMTPAASLSFLTLSVSPGFQPCGVLLPGFGMAGGIGALVVNPASQIMLPPGPLWIGAPAAFLLPLPSAPILAGKSLHFQGALYDLTSGDIGLTEGKRVLLGK